MDSATIRMPPLRIMSHKADQNGAAVYAYIFSYGNSYHGAEIPHVFAHAKGSGAQETLSEQISGAWIQFVKTGVPGAEGCLTGSRIPVKAARQWYLIILPGLLIITTGH